MKIHATKGAAGVNLHVREHGKLTGIPILLIHGWSQSHLCWSKQYESTLKDEARIVALDLRGHGMSDAPVQIDQYTDGDKWADESQPSSMSLHLIGRYWLVGHMEATSFPTICAEKAKGTLLASISSTPLSSLAQRPLARFWGRAFWITHQAPVRTIFRPILRRFASSCALASSSQFRRTISKKFSLSIWR
jgi:pimeloyl-ACP methyl ester carboxylesterase